MKQKELVLKGNVKILQMISMRDKKSGRYLPMMDGNVNSMLHRIYNNLDQIDKVVMTVPELHLLNIKQFTELKQLNQDLFDSKIEFEYSKLYGKDVGTTRSNMLSCDFIVNSKDFDLVISEFPINISSKNFRTKIVFNYNWGAVDESNELLNKSFETEKLLAQNYETYLFSNIQYEYWQSKDVNMQQVHRSKSIYSTEFFQRIAKFYIDKAFEQRPIDPLVSAISLLDESLRTNIMFFPMRIDDPRYRFDEALLSAYSQGMKVVITNPTNVAVIEVVDTIERLHDTIDLRSYIIDLSASSDKRTLYLYILSILRHNDIILHYEKDMHVSLIEQLAISNAKIIHDIGMIDDYIYERES